MTNIGILTTLNDELAPFLIKKINKLKNVNFFIIISKTKKNYKLKFLKIFKERTGDYFLKYNLDLLNSNIRLPTYLVNSHNCKEFHKLIKKKNIKFLYNSDTPIKINKSTIKKVKGIINIHPGILPNYRGSTCPEWTLFNNDPLGITAHLMDENYDTGPIIKIKYLKFKKKNIRDYKDIRIKIYLLTLSLAKKIFKNIHKIKTYKQDENNSKYFKVMDGSCLLKIKNKIKQKKIHFNKKNLII